MSKQDKEAESYGWLTLLSNEAYERNLNRNSSLYILKEGKKWCAWRGYWKKGKREPTREKIIISKVSFQVALRRANGYIDYINKFKMEKRK